MAARNFSEEAILSKIDHSRIKEQGTRSAFTIDPVEIYLPFPPSVNSAYANATGIGRVKTKRFHQWARVAGTELQRQRPKRIAGPVWVAIYLEDSPKRQGDADNRIKAALDLMVIYKIIEGDTKKTVRRVSAEWSSSQKECRVSIRPAPIHGGAE